MYEIWLMVVIVWELALTLLPWVLGLLAFALAGWALAATGRSCLRNGLKRAAVLGLLIAVAVFFLLPSVLQSSLSELRYWVDWVALGGVALGAGVVGFLTLWPWLARGQQRAPA